MKTLLALLVGLTLFASISFGQETGRYQLVAATISVGSEQRSCLFRIDTTTGETSQLVIAFVPTKTLQGVTNFEASGWVPIHETVNQAIDEIKVGFPDNLKAPHKP